jgi:hypothetical protein
METQVIEKTETKPKVTRQQAVEKAVAGLPGTNAVTESASILAMLERVSQNPNVNVDTMKAMLDMWERIQNKNAEVAFNRDFAAMSLDMPRIQRDGSVSYENKKTGQMEEAFKFALYEDIDKVIRPILERHGFSLSFTTSERQGGGLTVNGILAHREGHSRTTSLPLALDTSGGKNNLQAMGSSSSYGRRYAACILLNIITVEEDDNGSAEGIQRDVNGSNFSMGIDRAQAEQVHEQALEKIEACDSLDKLKATWRGYAKTLKSLPEDLATDLIQKKDECKANLEAQAGITVMDAG